MRHLVRYSEFERYDISKDAEVIRFMAITEKGSYWAEAKRDSASGYRRNKEAFKEEVVRLIQSGKPPCEVRLG